ncbi:histidine triad (HIT) family protein [Keratinibaculum paraultunense]|uniref:Histidine triad (HIT) family protein n=1 Tax=Keratinibaculum paraultunense TaxID=1278232 RepID=A0A4V2UUJ6_9FIRM|nr:MULTISPECIES: histidine triad nucleotide-binding protein [Bacillota]QQY80466.1 histidine triad nucleotide-binding protein [Keratinibaculum paraultunense]TCS91184.1 histidine triad (HIT) family protein [Keratinibaculum paraultunense]
MDENRGGEKVTDCVFCSIIDKEIPSEIIYEDDKVIAFKDANPQAPIHFLVIPREHIESLNSIDEENLELIGHIFYVIKKLVKQMGFHEEGYRIVNNCGEFGGQTVSHIHFHVLGGRKFSWPPG